MQYQYKKMLLLLPWTEYLDVHLKKDTTLFPVYFAKIYKIPVEIVFFDSPVSTKITSYRGVTLRRLEPVKGIISPPSLFKRPIKFLKFLLRMFEFIKKENGAISHIMLFHLTYYTAFLCLFIKKKYPHIKIYIKLDMTEFEARRLAEHGNLFQFFLFRNIIPHIDLVSSETTWAVSILHKKPFFSKTEYVPNGYDADLFSWSAGVLKRRCNTIITVGRLFSFPKNTELLLDILSELDFKDWNVRLIGPVETSSRNGSACIKAFFENSPHLRTKIEFVGNISDTDQLKFEYEKAKVFILLSRFEGSSLALVEAAMAGNYIIATDVGSIRDITADGKFGFICPESRQGRQNEATIKKSVKEHLQSIIDGKIDPQINGDALKVYCSDNFLMDAIVKNPCFKHFFTN
jgi:glycosyltransferase involved in cell wall biosynthesis